MSATASTSELATREDVQAMIDAALLERCAEYEKETKALIHRHNQQMISQRKCWQSFAEEAIKSQNTIIASLIQKLTAWSDNVVTATLYKHQLAIAAQMAVLTQLAGKEELTRADLDAHWAAINALQSGI